MLKASKLSVVTFRALYIDVWSDAKGHTSATLETDMSALDFVLPILGVCLKTWTQMQNYEIKTSAWSCSSI
jgi:hypothetical protein